MDTSHIVPRLAAYTLPQLPKGLTPSYDPKESACRDVVAKSQTRTLRIMICGEISCSNYLILYTCSMYERVFVQGVREFLEPMKNLRNTRPGVFGTLATKRLYIGPLHS